MDMASRHPIIHLPVIIHLMEGPLMGQSSGQAAVVSHGVEVVARYLAAGEGFVDGSGKEGVAWGL
jgi:hypothetical protein